MASNLFHRAHYNAIAKDIRNLYAMVAIAGDKHESLVSCRTLEALALKFCVRFKVDNPEFDPVQFLEQCSPNPNLYPLGELWDA
jgi:hypothetical protein